MTVVCPGLLLFSLAVNNCFTRKFIKEQCYLFHWIKTLEARPFLVNTKHWERVATVMQLGSVHSNIKGSSALPFGVFLRQRFLLARAI